MTSLSLLILAPQALRQLRSANAPEASTHPGRNSRDAVISAILFILMAASGIYAEILSYR